VTRRVHRAVQGGGETTDAALVRRVLEGDSRAFTSLVDRHAPDCLRFATRMLGNREDAEDATQEALMRAYRALGTFDERAAFRTWLFTIVVNQCRTMAVRRARRWRRVVADEARVAQAAFLPDVAATDAHHDLHRALSALDDTHREAFLLKHVEQLEYTEIAAMTGASVSALKMRVKRACARLQQALGGVADVRP
jgi:RNA polymerase sigma-70 factor (ECF subfamily)